MTPALEDWVGRREEVVDRLDAARAGALAATLDRDDPAPAPGDALPPGWHWIYFWPVVRHSGLGPDGHPRRGGFLPPVELPRRMWAGGRVTFHAPLRVGESARRESEIAEVQRKKGRSGALVFVTVRHRLFGPEGLAVVEDQDLVYREAPRPGAPARPARRLPGTPTWRRTVTPDPVLLFRFSALTFNGHRIHYDHPYATGEEGYPGLVVHGPLQAVLLLDLLRRERPRAAVARFAFRALRPVFDTAPFTVAGSPGDDGRRCALWILDAAGGVAMEAEAEVEPPAAAG